MIAFTVRGIPAPQGSKRLLPLGAKRGGRPILVESSKRVPKWRKAIRDEARRALEALPLEGQARATGPVVVDLHFRLPRPKGHYGTGRNAAVLRPSSPAWPASKPDLDKLVRAVLDALTGLLWVDDAQVVTLAVAKCYASPTVPAGVHVRVGAHHPTPSQED